MKQIHSFTTFRNVALSCELLMIIKSRGFCVLGIISNIFASLWAKTVMKLETVLTRVETVGYRSVNLLTTDTTALVFAEMQIISYNFIILKVIQINSQFWKILMLKVWLSFLGGQSVITSCNSGLMLSNLYAAQWLCTASTRIPAALHTLYCDMTYCFLDRLWNYVYMYLSHI